MLKIKICYIWIGEADKVLEGDHHSARGVEGEPVQALHCQGEGCGDK